MSSDNTKLTHTGVSMSPEQARIAVLEDAVEQAQNVVAFLHGCLTDPVYSYEHPEQTQHHMEQWAALVPPREYCAHSRLRPEDCESCREHIAKMERLTKARRVLDTPNPPQSEDS